MSTTLIIFSVLFYIILGYGIYIFVRRLIEKAEPQIGNVIAVVTLTIFATMSLNFITSSTKPISEVIMITYMSLFMALWTNVFITRVLSGYYKVRSIIIGSISTIIFWSIIAYLIF